MQVFQESGSIILTLFEAAAIVLSRSITFLLKFTYMQEKFITHIWKIQCFEKKNLNTNTGDSLQIIDIGEENINSGPDFLNAKILINNVLWHGHVELHTNASDWYLHNHHLNKAYNNVILHVVWNNDKPIIQENRSRIHTIELKNTVKSEVCESYNQFEQKIFFLALF